MTTTGDAHVRIRVSSGNAAAEIARVAAAADKVKASSGTAAPAVSKFERSTAKATTAAGALAAATTKVDVAQRKEALGAKALGTEIAKVAATTTRATTAAGSYARAVKAKTTALDTTAKSIKRTVEETKSYERAVDAAKNAVKRLNDENKKVTNPFSGQNAPFRRGGMGMSQQQIERLRNALGLGAAGLTGVAAYGRQGQATLGVRDQTDIVRSAVDLRQDLVRQTAPAGVTAAQRERLFAGSAEIGRTRGVSTEETLQALMSAQEVYSAIGNAADQGDAGITTLMRDMDRFAVVSRATGATMNDTTGAGLALKAQFGLTSEEMHEALALLAQGAQDGSLGLRDFAAVFPQVFAGYRSARGDAGRGMAGVSELQAVAQAIRASQGTGSEAAARSRTLFAAMIRNMSDVQVQRRFKNATGQSAIDARTGNLRPISELAQAIVGSRRNFNSSTYQSVFGDAEAASAWQGIVGQERAAAAGEDGALTLEQRQRATAEQGQAGIDATIAALDRDVSGQAVRMRADREANTFGSSEALINAFASIAGPLTSLQDRFPRLSTAVESLVPVVQALIPLMAVRTAAGAAGSLPGFLGVGGAGAASVTSLGAGAVVPAIGAALVGVGIGTALHEYGEQRRAEQRDEAERIAVSQGAGGRVRSALEYRSNWTGRYDEEETATIFETLRNGRSVVGSDAGLMSSIQKARDIGAMDEIMQNPEMARWIRETEQRGRAQQTAQAAQAAVPGAPAAPGGGGAPAPTQDVVSAVDRQTRATEAQTARIERALDRNRPGPATGATTPQ